MSDNLAEIGIKRIRRVGHHTEFEQIKEYVKGDDYRTINWKASARPPTDGECISGRTFATDIQCHRQRTYDAATCPLISNPCCLLRRCRTERVHLPYCPRHRGILPSRAEKFTFEKRLIVSTLKQHGIYSLLTTPENLPINVINKYLEMKSRQLL